MGRPFKIFSHWMTRLEQFAHQRNLQVKPSELFWKPYFEAGDRPDQALHKVLNSPQFELGLASMATRNGEKPCNFEEDITGA